MTNDMRAPVVLILCVSLFTPSLSYAEKPTVEWIASEIARQHNANAEAMKDEMTVSSSAQAIGKNVILKYVLRVKRDVSKQKLDEYRSELYQEIVPKTCRVNSNNPAFKDGLFYTFVYVSHYGQPLAELVVNKRVCGSN
jgi:hypothetical protein